MTTLSIARLTRNPFTLVPDERVTIWAGYENLRTQLLDVIESCRSDRVGLSEFTILYGDYGTGKSHALRYLRYWITEKEKDDFVSPCVYLETIKVAASTNFVALYRSIMEQLIPHIEETASWLDSAVEKEVRGKLPDSNRREQDNAMERLYQDPQLTPGYPPLGMLLKEIKAGNDEPVSLLLGEKITGRGAMSKYRHYTMTGPIDSEYDATRCLGAYVNLCTRGAPALAETAPSARNKAFYFFVDELETVGDLRPQEVLSLNQGIRDLINACPENTCFLLGMTGDVQLLYALLTQPVIRRMSRDPLELEPLVSQEAVDFLVEVLKAHRLDSNDQDAYPFTKEALTVIAEDTQRKTPSDLFRGCRRVLEKSVLSGSLDEGGLIDADMAREAL